MKFFLIGSAVLAAFLISILVTPLVKKIAYKIGAIDAPDKRKVHVKAMPRLGGLAIYLGFIIPMLIFYELDSQVIGLLVSGTLITIIGVIDDKIGLSPKVKLLGQVAASLVLIAFGIQVEFITNPMGIRADLGILSIPVTILWVVGLTNAVNLIDGLDGLAAGISAISATILGVVALIGGNPAFAMASFILAGSCLGFLKHNFYPAKIFMGDSGSLFLGFNLAALAIMGLAKSATIVSLVIPILIMGIPIFDTFFAIVRRFSNKKPIFEADKGHLHHRLMSMGLSHKNSVLVMYGVAMFLGGSAVILNIVTTAQAMVLIVILSVFLLICAERIGILGIKIGRKKSDSYHNMTQQRNKEM